MVGRRERGGMSWAVGMTCARVCARIEYDSFEEQKCLTAEYKEKSDLN